jgi:predicted MFS family arabinose efflux permease
MLPLGLFAVRDFAVANAATVAIYAGLGAFTFLVALYVQQIAGYSATAAGLSLMPVTVMLVAFSRRFGRLAARIGPRPLMGAGPLVAAAGALLFLRLGARVDYLTDLLPAACIFGLGLAATVAPLTATVLGAADPAHAGVASGVNNAVARVASLLAIALVGLVVSLRFTGVLDTRLAAARLPAAQRALVAAVRARPLTRPVGAGAPLTRAATAASISAFRYGVGASALLVAAGGLIALIGLSRRPAWHP